MPFTVQLLPLDSCRRTRTFIITMETLSGNLLSLILPAVGCIAEVIRLREVCKRWKDVLSTLPLTVSFEFSSARCMQSWHIPRLSSLWKSLSSFNLSVLNLRYQTVSPATLTQVFLACKLRKLDLSYCNCRTEFMQFVANALRNETCARNCEALEELRLSGFTEFQDIDARKTMELFTGIRRLYVNNVSSSGLHAQSFFTP